MPTPEFLVCFAHGNESGPWGIKITRLADVARTEGFDVVSPDYSHTHDPDERVTQLTTMAPSASRAVVLAGSSMGGYVSAMACSVLRPAALFLMAPALYFPGYDREADDIPAICDVVHGWDDDIVPVDRAIRFARAHRARLHVLDSGHTLSDRLEPLTLLFAELLRRVRSAAG